jgi:integrase
MSKDAPEVKRFPGVKMVPQSTKWQYWKRNPDTLLNHPAIAGEQWACRVSLGTSDLREANARAAAKLAELEAYWATLRASLKVTKPADITPALRDAIAQRVKVGVLAEDDKLRADPVALAASLAAWWTAKQHALKVAHELEHGSPRHPGPPTESELRALAFDPEPAAYRSQQPPQWLTLRGLEDVAMYTKAGRPELPLHALLPLLIQRHAEAAEQSRAAMARGATGPYLLLADAAAKELGVNLGQDGWQTPDAKPLRDACHRAYLEALEGLALRGRGEMVPTPEAPMHSPLEAPKNPPQGPAVLTLRAVVDAVIEGMPANEYKRKTATVTGLLLAMLGEATPVQELKQSHISGFMADICRLPADWYTQAKRGVKVSDMVRQDHPKCLSPSTFTTTYKACMGAFLDRAKHEFQDQGFPGGLSVRFASYKGTREDNEEQQRNFKPPELVRLFGSAAYAELAQAPDMAHRYWLPLLALYTGARPRELCQINPQVDYGMADDIPFFRISEETAADEGVVKTVKTGEERHVPIHPELIRLGFLAYVDGVKDQGARRLFPGFPVHKGNPYARAGDWFSGFLDELGLRDETPKAMLSGMYAFKKTFITEAARLGLRFQPITGHAEEQYSKVVRDSYNMEELPLRDKLAVLRQVVFAVEPPRMG